MRSHPNPVAFLSSLLVKLCFSQARLRHSLTWMFYRNISFLVACSIAYSTTCQPCRAEDPVDKVGGKPVPVWCLDFSPDGSMLAVAGGEREGGGILQIWNAHDWSCVLDVPEDRALTCVAFSPDGQSLVIGTQKGQFAIFDLATKKTTAFWESGKWAVYGATWTPDGKRIVGACANGVIKVWDAKTQALQITFDIWEADGIVDPGLRSHSDRNQWDVAVSADGKTLLSGGWNDTTRLWNMETHKLIRQFGAEDQSTQGVKLMPNEKHFVSASMKTGCVRIREIQSFRERMTLPVSGRDLAVHPDGTMIAASSMTDVRIYRVNLDQPTAENRMRAIALIKDLDSPDENLRSTALTSLQSMGPTIEPILYDAIHLKQKPPSEKMQELLGELLEQARKPTEITVLGNLQGEVRQVVFCPQGKLIATSTLTGNVHVFAAPDFKLEHQFKVTSFNE